MDAFPLSAPGFNGDCRKVPPGNAIDWLRQGWATFLANPGAWVAIAILFFVVFLGLSIVPLVGQLAAHLLMPVLAGGLMFACHKIARDETIEISDLFLGFRRDSGPLVMLGVVYMLGMLAIFAIVALLVGGSMAGGMVTGRTAGVGIAFGGMLLAGFLSLALSLPLLMAMWFAPALVSLNRMQPVPALKASFNACLRNGLPFLVYGLLLMVLAFFAAVPLGLGFLILLPVLAGSVYASYRDLFIAA